MGGQELDDTAFAKAVKELIEGDQETELVLAIFDGSELYQLKEPFRKLHIQRDVWFSMREEQRTKKGASIYGADIEDLYSVNDRQGMAQTCFARYDKGSDCCNELSITPAAMKDSLDIHIAKQFWKKAERLISQPDTIMPADHEPKKILRHFLLIFIRYFDVSIFSSSLWLTLL